MKIDITLTKDLTINCGRYSSIKPAVTITLKNIDAKDLHTMTEKLMKVVSSAWKIQAALDLKEINKALSTPALEYKNTLTGQVKEARENLKQFVKEVPDDMFSID